MNKNCYRIIFNRQKGQLMVVSELANRNGCVTTASSTAKTTSQSVIAKLKPLCLMVGMALGSVVVVEPAMAEIIADNTAAAHQQPQIIQQGGNNPQIVNIQAPNESGLSHNKYTQFDVDKNGAILNNSNHSTKTKLGGRIDGNANLANGQAKIILNEVNSRNPSQLNGFIEVAGQKAQVIIANPSGIACDGCGFINADKATLTTGKPQIEEGKLKGYSVTQGTISINGAGLDSRKQDYTEIIARSVEVNAGIWGNDIKVVTGRNEVSADLNTVTAYDDNNDDKPRLAVDVSALGGMYAGKIHLVGTEKGVGVNNDGRLTASKDSIVLKADGKIVNAGTIQAKDDIFIKSAQSIENTKQINSKKNVKLISRRQIVNEGSLVAQQGDIKAKARKVVLHGTNSAGQQINVKANALADLSNSNTTAKSLTVNSGNTIDVNSAALNVDNDIKLVSEESINSNNMEAKTTGNFIAQSKDIENKGATIIADKDIVLTATNTLNNELATLQTEATLNLTGNTVNNDQANLEAGNDILVTSTKLTAKDASLTSDNNIKIDSAEQFDAENIKIDAKGEVNIASKGNINAKNANITTDKNLAIQADQLVLTAAEIEANDAINVNASLINNAEATWHSKGDIAVSGDNINNSGSSISSDKSITLNAIDTINNSESELFSQDFIKIVAKNVDNKFANIASNSNIALQAEELINNSNATLNSKGEMRINGSKINNTKAEITAANLAIEAATLSNQEAKLTTLGGENYDGSMTISGNQVDNSKATLTSAGNMTITTDYVHDNPDQLNNSEAILNSKGTMQISGRDIINNTKAKISAADLSLNGTTILNQEAVLNALSGGMNITSTDLNNTEATLSSKGKMLINGTKIDNTKSKITAGDLAVNANTIINQEAVLTTLGGENYEGSMTITGNQLDNSKATLTSAGNMVITTDQLNNTPDELNNSEATLISQGKMEINSYHINNEKAKISANDLKLIANTLLNKEAVLNALSSEGGITIDSDTLDNSKATLTSAGNMTIKSNQVDNNEATLNSRGNIQIDGDYIDNMKAKISAIKDLILKAKTVRNQEATLTANRIDITATDYLDNQQATLVGKEGISINTDEFDNIKAVIETEGQLDITAGNINNNKSDMYAKQIQINANKLENQDAYIRAYSQAKINADDIINSRTNILADDLIDIVGNALTNDSKLSSNNISINLKDGLSNTDRILAKNQLSVKAKQISNEGKLVSENALTLNSDLVKNGIDGLIDAQNIQIEGDSLSNNGLINGDNVNVKLSGQFDNNDSARVFGEQVSIVANELNNKASSMAVEKAPIIAAKQSLNIDANTLNNYNHALLLSQDNMFVKATTLNNHSARIESYNDMDIMVDTLNNINDSITTEVIKVKDQVVHEFAPIASSQRYDAEDVSVVVNPDKNHRNYILKSKTGAFKDTERFNEYNYNVTGYETIITNTAPAEIVSGHNLYVNAAHVNNTSSSILAGNEVSIDEKIVNNVSTQGITREESKGTMTYHYPIRKGIDTVNKGTQTTSYEKIDESKLDFHDAKVENNADIVKTNVRFESHWVEITGGK